MPQFSSSALSPERLEQIVNELERGIVRNYPGILKASHKALRGERDDAVARCDKLAGLLLWLQAKFYPDQCGNSTAVVQHSAEQWQELCRILDEWLAEGGSDGEDTVEV